MRLSSALLATVSSGDPVVVSTIVWPFNAGRICSITEPTTEESGKLRIIRWHVQAMVELSDATCPPADWNDFMSAFGSKPKTANPA